MVRVKICGITSLEDALFAVEAGADALGFVFYENSPRRITPESAADIIAELPPFVTKVGVFVDSPLETVQGIMALSGLDIAQLHGQESVDFCQALFPRAIKAFGVQGSKTLSNIAGYRAKAYLLDAYNPGLVGGTGQTFDWEIAREAAQKWRILLAGGLCPDNVRDAITRVEPYGVDVSTGVETSPAKKDPRLMREFIRAAKAAGYEASRPSPSRSLPLSEAKGSGSRVNCDAETRLKRPRIR